MLSLSRLFTSPIGKSEHRVHSHSPFHDIFSRAFQEGSSSLHVREDPSSFLFNQSPWSCKKEKKIHPKRKRKKNKKKSHSFKILILQMLPILTDPSTIPLPCCLWPSVRDSIWKGYLREGMLPSLVLLVALCF